MYGLTLMAIATMSACDDELVDNTDFGTASTATDTTTRVSITANIDSNSDSRVIADGVHPTQLLWAVYADGVSAPIAQGDTTFVATSAVLNLSLPTDICGRTLLWAQTPGAPYTFDAQSGEIAVDYSPAVTMANDASRQAYCASVDLDVAAETDYAVELYSPFAQVEVLTFEADLESAVALGVWPTLSEFAAPVYSRYNIATGEVEGDPQLVTFAADAVENPYATGGASAPDSSSITGGPDAVDGFCILANNYLLTLPAGELIDCTLRCGEAASADVANNSATDRFQSVGNPVELQNVPVKAGGCTRVIGEFLTTSVTFGVAIASEYSEDDFVHR